MNKAAAYERERRRGVSAGAAAAASPAGSPSGGGGAAKEEMSRILSLAGRKYGATPAAAAGVPGMGTRSTICFLSMSCSLPKSFCLTVSNARSRFSICSPEWRSRRQAVDRADPPRGTDSFLGNRDSGTWTA